MQALADTHDTPKSSLSPVPLFGLGFTDQPPARPTDLPAAAVVAGTVAASRTVACPLGVAAAPAVVTGSASPAIVIVARADSRNEGFTTFLLLDTMAGGSEPSLPGFLGRNRRRNPLLRKGLATLG